MAGYEIKIRYIDDEVQTVDLANLSHEQAENYTAELRQSVEEARNINAPEIPFSLPGVPEPLLTLEPGRIRSIDLEEIE